MMRRFVTLSAVLLAGWTVNTAVYAADVGGTVSFSDGELQAIHAFYRESQPRRGGGMGGGRQGLPPGIAKNLERGKALPPGLQTASLPVSLEENLPPAPDGYERIVVDAKILLVETATRLIADVIAGAILD